MDPSLEATPAPRLLSLSSYLRLAQTHGWATERGAKAGANFERSHTQAEPRNRYACTRRRCMAASGLALGRGLRASHGR
jgi:hypothetical protein